MSPDAAGPRRGRPVTPVPGPVRVVPADQAPWEHLREVFGTRGAGSRCFCQRYKLDRGESFGSAPPEDRADRLRRQAGCDGALAAGEVTSGLVAYAADEPVGWCAVEPRPAYAGLLRVYRVAWEGREQDRTDPDVWAVTCLFVRAGRRRRGVSRALALAAVEHARAHGARAVEAYPTTTTAAVDEELHVGTVPKFAAAGLVVVARPFSRRAVMRLDLG